MIDPHSTVSIPSPNRPANVPDRRKVFAANTDGIPSAKRLADLFDYRMTEPGS